MYQLCHPEGVGLWRQVVADRSGRFTAGKDGVEEMRKLYECAGPERGEWMSAGPAAGFRFLCSAPPQVDAKDKKREAGRNLPR